MRVFIYKFLIYPSFALPYLLFAEEHSSKNVYDSIIKPILEAKCQDCHGQQKDKGKLRLHTKEDLLKGGRNAQESIIVPNQPSESELIFRITLPKDDEEAMPPFEEEDHYNPVTSQELSVLKAWIKLGADFDLLVSQLDNTSRKAAEHVFQNMPKPKISSIALKIPKLPEVPKANPNIINDLTEAGLLVMHRAQNTYD